MGLITRLPLDLEGTALSNRISGEEHSLIKVNNRKNRVLVPRFGAFYENNFVLYNAAGQRLTKGTDYILTYLYDDMSFLTGHSIYAVVVVTNPNVSAQVKIDYRALGGPNVINVKELRAVLDQLATGKIELKYSDLVGKPDAFIPEDHDQLWWQIYGMDSTVDALNRIGESMVMRDDYIEAAAVAYGDRLLAECQAKVSAFAEAARLHYIDYTNPHGTDKDKISLGNMNNWGLSTDDQAKAKHASVYLTPSGAYQLLALSYVPAINQHVNRQDNPHGITPAQIDTIPKATQVSRINTLLNRGATAVGTKLLSGITYADLFAAARRDIPLDNVVSGIFAPARLGTSPGANRLLTSNGTFRAIADIFTQYGTKASNLIWLAYYGNGDRYSNMEAARQQLNATFNDLTTYPVGSYAFCRVRNMNHSLTSYEMAFFTRTSTGWVTSSP